MGLRPLQLGPALQGGPWSRPECLAGQSEGPDALISEPLGWGWCPPVARERSESGLAGGEQAGGGPAFPLTHALTLLFFPLSF